MTTKINNNTPTKLALYEATITTWNIFYLSTSLAFVMRRHSYNISQRSVPLTLIQSFSGAFVGTIFLMNDLVLSSDLCQIFLWTSYIFWVAWMFATMGK